MSETIVVTGALGGAGSWIADRLKHEYNVVAIDRTLPESLAIDNIDFQAVDLTDQGAVWETVIDVAPTAVVHFGNIPHEENHAGGTVYENNAMASYHVLEAAGRTGARVIWASSETVYGTHWPEPPLPSYLPIDEEHPVAPWNGYETSKLAGEMIAERVTNAFGIPVVSVRPSWIQYPGEYVITPIREEFSLASAGRFGNLWSYVDIRDVVNFVELALRADLSGHEVINLFASDNFLGVPTAEAIEAGFGTLPEDCELTSDESGFSMEKAHDLFNWAPEHSWKSAESERIDGPEFRL